MRPSELATAISFAIENKFPVLVTGSPGIGKTDIIKQCCEKAGVDLIITHPVVSDPTDYKGLPFPVKGDGDVVDTATFLPYGDLVKCITADRPTVYFMDDMGQAPASVQASIMQLVLARSIGQHKVSDHVIFIAATNGRGDRAAVQGILEPVKSRFIILELKPDVEDWIKWALGPGKMPPKLAAFVQWRRTKGESILFDFNPTSDIVNSPSPRTIATAGEIMKRDCPESVLQSMLEGAAGNAFAVEYLAFVRMFDALPNVDDIRRDPEGTPIPEETSVMYAVATSLAGIADKSNISYIYKYVLRMSPEITAVFMRLSSNRCPDIEETKEFDRYLENYSDMMIQSAHAGEVR